MRRIPALACLAAAATTAVATDRVEPRGEWIDQLSSDSYTERLEATRALWAEGAGAVEALRQAARSRDPEKAIRSRELLRKIDLGLTPDTDPEIVRLTERYTDAENSEKTTIFQELRRRRAWRQLLRLYAGEEEPSVRENVSRLVDGAALYAARERIAAGDPGSAREYLEMANATPGGLVALAAFHRAHGTLREQIEAVGEPATPQQTRWLVALHRAAGEAEAAANLASAVRDDLVAAAMFMAAGDPLPWLDHFASGANLADEPANLYARAVAARWRGGDDDGAQAGILRLLRSRDETMRARAMSLLFLLGETSPAWDYLRQSYPENAFLQFDALERPAEALAAIDFDPENPDFEGFFKTHLETLTRLPGDDEEDEDGDDGEDGEEADEAVDDEAAAALARVKFIAMCNFLERRGRHDVLDQWVMPGLLEFAEKHPPRFADLLGDLFATPSVRAGASELATRTAIAWASQGEDETPWEDAVAAAFGEDSGYTDWWALLATLDPEASRADRLRGMLALFRYIRDPEGLGPRWFDLAWKALEDDENPAESEMFSHIEFLLGNIIDAQAVDRLVRIGAEHGRKVEMLGDNFLIHISLGRWNDAADFFLRQIALNVENGYEPRADFHAYAAAMLRRADRGDEADNHEALAEALALGDPRMNLAIAYAYGYGRDYERSARWFHRAVMESDPTSQFFSQALRAHTTELLEVQDFKTAAACAEVLAQVESADQGNPNSSFEWIRLRQQADFTRALSLPEERRDEAGPMLAAAHAMSPTDGALADHFFPSLRHAGFIEVHDALFETSWKLMLAVLEAFPDADNTMNAAGWFASRSNRRLDEARKLLERALALNPRQPAYLDTLGEIGFAQGNRDEAVRLSALALRFMPQDTMILRQHERFMYGPFPK